MTNFIKTTMLPVPFYSRLDYSSRLVYSYSRLPYSSSLCGATGYSSSSSFAINNIRAFSSSLPSLQPNSICSPYVCFIRPSSKIDIVAHRDMVRGAFIDDVLYVYLPSINYESCVISRNVVGNIIYSRRGFINTMCTNKNIRYFSVTPFYRDLGKSGDTKYNIRNRQIMFSEIKNIIYKNPTNNRTQRMLENYLLNLDNNRSLDHSKIFEVIGALDTNLKDILLLKKEELTKLIINFKSRKLETNVSNLKDSELAGYYLKVILGVVNEMLVVSILLGIFIVIVNKPKQEDNKLVGISSSIGKQLIQYYFYFLYNKERKEKLGNVDLESEDSMNRFMMSDWRSENQDLIKLYDSSLLYNIAGILIQWLEEVDLLKIKLVKSLEDNKEVVNILVPTSFVEPHLKLKTLPLNLPENLPMIVKPKNYTISSEGGVIKLGLGGYLLNDHVYAKPLIIKNWRSRDSSEIKYLNIVYSGINTLGSVGYKINKDVLKFIRTNDTKFGLTMTNLSNDLDNKLSSELSNQELIELESFNSKKYVEDNIFAIADVYENIPEFFLPVRMDYRGRIYCISNYLSYQGTELSKALLLFSKGEKILKTDLDSIEYLKVFGANCFGNSKKSKIDRLNWVDENTENIYNFENGILLSQAESKYLFIAFCIEYRRWLDCLNNSEVSYFETYLPIQLDATCNGFQHLAMLGQNTELSKNLNLNKRSKGEKPDDFYTFLVSLISRYFGSELEGDQKLREEARNFELVGDTKSLLELKKKLLSDEDVESYKRLTSTTIQRSIIKKAVMTIPYNVSSLNGIKYLQESFEIDSENTRLNNEGGNKQVWFRHKDNNEIKLEYKDFINIWKALCFVLNEYFPYLNKLTKYLKDIASVCSDVGLSIPWTLPTGLVASQSYLEVKDVRLKPFSYKPTTFTIKVIKENIDKKKQIRAFMPNLIHSLDAASLVMLVNCFTEKGNSMHNNIFAIHDCFAVTSNNMSFIIENLKLVYISIYSDSGYLSSLNKEIIRHIKAHLGKDFNTETREIIIRGKDDNVKKRMYPDISKVLDKDFDIKMVLNSSYIIN